MAQNITLLGASYSDVPSVELPKTGGGTAQFDDTTIASNAASASDITSGKLAFVNGELVTGTASGGGATLITKSITANGTYNASSDNADGYSSVTVNVSGGGGGGDMSDPIRFFDYDGTLVASYSAVPASLPSVPSHTGLTNGTWNHTLQQVTTQFNAVGTCDVGANYETVSGATEIDIVLQEGRLHPYLSLAVNGTVSIDWGDNSTSTSTGTSLTSRKNDIHHEYAAAGSYTIKITKTSGTGYSLHCTSTYPLLNKNSSTSNANRVYSNCINAVRVGANCTIGSYAFYYCYSLMSVSIPSTVTSIGSSAFGYCYSLMSVSIPSGVTSIGDSAFYNCYSLASVSIPSTVTSIGNSAFYYCFSLMSVPIPSGTTSIGNSAFYYCYSLMSVSIPGGVTSFGSSAFGYCQSLMSVSIMSGATSIGSSAFSYCYSLMSVSIPSTVTSIGYGAFYNCYSLASIDLPSGLTTISANKGAYTTGFFANCYSLASITIPTGVTAITTNDFNSCYGMGEYHFKPTTPPTLANVNAFNNIQSDCVIYVPAASLDTYKTANNWSTYASYMVGE